MFVHSVLNGSCYGNQVSQRVVMKATDVDSVRRVEGLLCFQDAIWDSSSWWPCHGTGDSCDLYIVRTHTVTIGRLGMSPASRHPY